MRRGDQVRTRLGATRSISWEHYREQWKTAKDIAVTGAALVDLRAAHDTKDRRHSVAPLVDMRIARACQAAEIPAGHALQGASARALASRSVFGPYGVF